MGVTMPRQVVIKMQSVPMWMVVIIAIVNLDLLVMETPVQVYII